mmetsp:Transcript_65331/g.142351  ORF Transcript_65331/g.142351 Transcript_65331/m.142351 type:complete len:291 (+) Transcript_65331:597-1469(+)
MHEATGSRPGKAHCRADIEHIDLSTHIRVVVSPLVQRAVERFPVQVAPGCTLKVPDHRVHLQRVGLRDALGLAPLGQRHRLQGVERCSQAIAEQLNVPRPVVSRPDDHDRSAEPIPTRNQRNARFDPLERRHDSSFRLASEVRVLLDSLGGIIDNEVRGYKPLRQRDVVQRIMQAATIRPVQLTLGHHIPQVLESISEGILRPLPHLITANLRLAVKDAVADLLNFAHHVLEPVHQLRSHPDGLRLPASWGQAKSSPCMSSSIFYRQHHRDVVSHPRPSLSASPHPDDNS